MQKCCRAKLLFHCVNSIGGDVSHDMERKWENCFHNNNNRDSP